MIGLKNRRSFFPRPLGATSWPQLGVKNESEVLIKTLYVSLTNSDVITLGLGNAVSLLLRGVVVLFR